MYKDFLTESKIVKCENILVEQVKVGFDTTHKLTLM